MPRPDTDWKNSPDPSTPLGRTNLKAAEDAQSDYVEEVAAGGIELGYAETQSSTTQTGVGSKDIPGLTTTVTVGSRPIEVEFETGSVANSATNGYTYIRIQEGSTVLAQALHQANGVANVVRNIQRKVRLDPSPGAHTYKVVIGQLVAGNSVMAASDTDPASISVKEV